MQKSVLLVAFCVATARALCPPFCFSEKPVDLGEIPGGNINGVDVGNTNSGNTGGGNIKGGSADAGQCGTHDASHPPALQMDGDSISGVSNGISGGSEANPHSYPWLVHLMMSTQHCGGSLISRQYVLTAAHCVADDSGKLNVSPSGIEVQLGAHSSNSPAKTVTAASVTVHPKYRGACKGTGFDVAVIKLNSAITFNDKIRAICLPKQFDNFAKYGTKYLVAGWGDAGPNNPGGSTEMRHTVLDSRDAYACPKANKKGEMCAGTGDGKSVCSGDSGGPLVGRAGGKFIQVGITSCGACGATPGWTGGATFTHVPSVRQWIKENTGV